MVLKPGFREYLAYEGAASVIRQYDPLLISGLLQTEEYGRPVLNAGGLDADDVERAWAVRQHRQEVHDREDPPEMYFIIDEAAIRRQIGGPRTMARQLERLKEYAAQPHITVWVLPFARGAHAGLSGNFVLLALRGGSRRSGLYRNPPGDHDPRRR